MHRKFRFVIFLLLSVVGISYRLLWQDLPNIEPVTLVCLLAGTYLGKEKYLIPIIVMFCTDLFLGISLISIFVYSAFIVTVLLGITIKNPLHSMVRGFYSSIFFFIWTNFGAWLLFDMYPKNLAGLLECYLMGIPFYRNTFISSTIIVGIGYGLIYLGQKVWSKNNLFFKRENC